MKTLLKNSLLLATGLVLSAAAANAAVYHITIDTSTLAATGNGPFYLDFQLNGGETPGNNTAVISSFTFGGGSAVVGSDTSIGNASGTLATSITLGNNTPFTEFYQQFNPGTLLQFDLNVTQNLDGLTPDLFAFSILDKDLFSIETTDDFDTLVTFNFDTTGPLTISTSSGSGTYAGVTASIPEPSAGLLGLLAGGLCLSRRRRGV